MPETAPQKPDAPKQEPRSMWHPMEIWETTIDYWKKFFKKERDELREEIEEQREGVFEKDGVKFREMEYSFLTMRDQTKYEELQKFTQQLEKKAEKVETAPEMIDRLLKKEDLDPNMSRADFEQEVYWLKRYLRATSYIESNDRYNVLGEKIDNGGEHQDTEALGRYQIMPKNWIRWSKLYLDGRVAEPTPQAQEYIAYRRMVDHYINLRKQFDSSYQVYTAMANRWHGGEATETFLATDKEIAISSWYSKKVLKRMGLKPSLRDMVEGGGAKLEKLAKDTVKGVRDQVKKALNPLEWIK